MQNNCLTRNIIYETTVTKNADIVEKIYFGLCESSFKERYRNHTRSLRLQSYSKNAKLSKLYVWESKSVNKGPFIKWRILKKVYAKPRFNYCKLFLIEKLYITNSVGDEKLLYKKSQFVSKCRRQKKIIDTKCVIKR